MRRHGMFYAIDAIIALVVLAVGVTVLFVAYTHEPPKQQTETYARDLIGFFRSTDVRDVKEEWLVNMWCIDGPLCTAPTHNITRPEQTLLSACAQLIREGKKDTAAYIAARLGGNMVQPQFSWSLNLTINGASVALVDNAKGPVTSQYIVEKALVYAVVNNTLEGPYVAQAAVWQ